MKRLKQLQHIFEQNFDLKLELKKYSDFNWKTRHIKSSTKELKILKIFNKNNIIYILYNNPYDFYIYDFNPNSMKYNDFPGFKNVNNKKLFATKIVHSVQEIINIIHSY